MSNSNITDRRLLQEIRDAAIDRSNLSTNPDWVRAYLALADAADKLDAMQARTTVQTRCCEAPDCGCDGHTGCEQEEPPSGADCGPYGRKRYE